MSEVIAIILFAWAVSATTICVMQARNTKSLWAWMNALAVESNKKTEEIAMLRRGEIE